MPRDTDHHRSGDRDETYFRVEWRQRGEQTAWSHSDQRYTGHEAITFTKTWREKYPEREWRVRRVTERTVF